MDKILENVYYDVSSPACYAGIKAVLREAKRYDPSIRIQDVKEFMEKQDTYTLHKPVRRKFLRNRVVATGIDSDWQADLCDMQALRKYNDNVAYLLTVIDVLSKHAWARPTTSKTPAAVRDAFAIILVESQRKPQCLYTDQGKEFLGKPFQQFLKHHWVQHITSNSPDVKASVAERYNRTLKTRLWKYMTKNNTQRYIDDLQAIVDSINGSYHRMIKRRPIDVMHKNETEVWETLYADSNHGQPSFKFKVGDQVRISKYKHIFEKGYLPNFTQEIFTIRERISRNPPVYRLKDYNSDPIEGVFYEQELVKTIKEDDVYKIEKILQHRTRRGVKEFYVKWLGYPNSFNQWIPERDLALIQ